MIKGQKAYYKAKIRGFQRMLWDLELQRFTNGSLREQAREEYDQLMSRKDALDKREIDKSLTVEQAKEEEDRMTSLKKEVDSKIESIIKEMDLFDAILNGRQEEGKQYIEGINDKIDTVRSTMQKTKEFLNGRG